MIVLLRRILKRGVGNHSLTLLLILLASSTASLASFQLFNPYLFRSRLMTLNPAVSLATSGLANPTVLGASNSFTLTAVDGTGNTVTGYSGTVHFSSSDTNAVVPPDYAFQPADNGTHSFSVVFCSTGSQTVTATDTADNTITGSASSQVNGLVVTNTNDSGPGSFRQALLNSNNCPPSKTITFNIGGGGPQTIAPTSALPIITTSVIIDGRSEPGYAGLPIIELSGANAGFVNSGLHLTAGNCAVQGLIMNRFSGGGLIRVDGPGSNIFHGNFFGTDVSGAVANTPNATDCIQLSPTAVNNLIGGLTAADRNVIAGTGFALLLGSDGNIIEGNNIGIDISGTVALPNPNPNSASFGIEIDSGNNIIGGTAPGARNIISGLSLGVVINGGSGNTIQGNYIGTDANGVHAVPNGTGINVNGYFNIPNATNNVIGGSGAAARNIISGNTSAGIILSDPETSGNVIQGNYIGTDVTGTVALPNGEGLYLYSGVTNNTIGGSAPGDGNLISGNTANGILVTGDGLPYSAISGDDNNTFQGNIIGADVTGSKPVPNGNNGIELDSRTNPNTGLPISASNNTIGGITPGQANIIAFNGWAGVSLGRARNTDTNVAVIGDTIRGNSIYGNGRLGIDLNKDGVTPNDPGDADTGPNNLQNFPVLTAASHAGGTTSVQGTLNSVANTIFTLDFYASANCDPSGFGQGQTYLGSQNVTTDNAGNVTFSASLNAGAASGQFITATATDPAGNTSEFSHCVSAAGPATHFSLTAPANANAGTYFNVTASSLDADGNIAGSYVGTVHFTSTDSNPTLPPDYTFQPSDNGSHTFSVSFASGGSQTVTVTDSADNTITGSAQVSVSGLVVTNTNDSGPGSLRQAILDSNVSPATKTISFNIPGAGAHTIAPASALPAITTPVVIDGTSQPGFAGQPIIELNGSSIKGLVGGLILTSANTVVQDLVINRCSSGIEISGAGATGNVVRGCFIGTDLTGTNKAPSGQGTGVYIHSGASGNTIGGLTPAARNIISGSVTGIQVSDSGSSGNVVEGNYIGTELTGTAPLMSPGSEGISVFSDGNIIGGTSPGAGNVISGNFQGLQIVGSSGNIVQGNFIGTDATGTKAVANSLGVLVGREGAPLPNATNNIIGGTTAAARNIISGNSQGINLSDAGTSGNMVEGNYIGTDVKGATALPNTQGGISVSTGAAGNTIGGAAAGAGNIISGNGGIGLWITGSGLPYPATGTDNNVVQGNIIGADVSGSKALGNASNGIEIDCAVNPNTHASVSASNNTIGGSGAGQANIIAFNGGAGVAVGAFPPTASNLAVTGNSIRGNSIFGNAKLGIDLNNDGVTANDPGDADAGPNNLQNFPVLSSAVTTGATATIQGSLNSTASATYTIDFYSVSTADPSGNGQGQVYLGSKSVTTDNSGNVSFSAILTTNVTAGQFITATATDAAGNSSEFAQDITLAGPAVHLVVTAPAADSGGAASNGPFGIVVTAKDSSGNTAVGYGGTVHFTSSDPNAQLPPDYSFTAADQGTHSFLNSVILRLAGSQTVTASDTGAASISGQDSIVVYPGTAARFTLALPATATTRVGFNFTITALDAAGNVANRYTGKIHFTSSDSGATLPLDYTFTSTDFGITTLSAEFQTKGSQSITATATADGTITGTSSVTVGTAGNIRYVTLTSNDIAYSPLSGKVYASVPDFAGSIGSSIIGIDPATSSIGAPVYFATSPGIMGASDDGQFIYASLDGNSTIGRLDVATSSVGLVFSLGTPLRAEDIQVVPGSPHSVAISRYAPLQSPRTAGTFVYDDGVQRPNGSYGNNVIAFGSTPSRLYGLFTESSALTFTRMLVDATGVTAITQNNGLVTSPAYMRFSGGLLYLANGGVIDPEAQVNVGALPGGGSLCADADHGAIYFVRQNNGATTVDVYDPATLAHKGTISVPGVQGVVHRTINWGPGGLAFNTDGSQIVFIGNLVSCKVSSSSNPSQATQPVTLTARVTPRAAAPSAPTGTVIFQDGSTVLATRTLDGSGQAAFTTTGLAQGIHSITAIYSGDDNFPNITSAVFSQIVNPRSTSHFNVTAPSPQTAGAPFSVTVSALDAANNPFTGYTGTVHLTSTDASAVLPADYTFTGADNGVHTFQVTLKTAGSQTMTATDTTAVTLTGTSQGIVVSGAAADHFTLTIPANTVSGSPFDVTLNALDAFNNIATGYAGAVHFTSTDTSAALPADYTFVAGDQSVHTFAGGVTLRTAGSQTITATDTNSPNLTGIASSTVSPAGASAFMVNGFPSPVAAGSAGSVTVRAVDSAGNTVTTYTGTIHFTSSDPAAVLPIDTTFAAADNGQHTFNATLNTAGVQSITASDTAVPSIQGSEGGIHVAPGAAVRFIAVAPSNATAGDSFNLTITALDASGNTASRYAGTVHLTSSDGAASLPADYSFTAADAGVHVFVVTLNGAGAQNITAGDTHAALTGITPTIQVAGGAATHFNLSAPASATAGSTTTVTVTALDASNNTAASYGGTVHFQSSDGAALLPADYTFVPADAGVRQFSITWKTSGNQTLTSADAGSPAVTGSATVSINPSSAASLRVQGFPNPATAGDQGSFRVTAVDAFGNAVPSYGGTVHFSSSDPAASLPADTAFTAADSGSRSLLATLNTAGTQSISAADAAIPAITGSQAGIAVGAGAGAHLSVSAPAGTAAGSPFNVTVSAKGAAGNLTPTYTGTVQFTSTDPAAVLPADYTFTGADGGSHTFTTTLSSAGSQEITVADIANSSINGNVPDVLVTSGPATHLVVSTPPMAAAGAPFTVTLRALDSFNNTATAYTGTIHFTSSDPHAVLPPDYAFQAADSGTHDFTLTLETSGNQSITATDTVNPTVSAGPTIAISPAAAVGLVVSGYPTTTVAGSINSFTVTVEDGFENTVPDYSGTVHFTSSDPTAVLPSDYTFNLADGSRHTFTGAFLTAGTQSISVTDAAANLSGTQTGIHVNAAGASHFTLKAPASVTAGTAFTLTLTAVDSSNNAAVGYTGVVHLSSSDASASLPADYTFTAVDGGIHTFSLTLKTAGGQSVEASDTGNPALSTSTPMAVAPGAATSLRVSGFSSPATAGMAGSITVSALDNSGNMASAYTGTIHFTSSDPAAAIPTDYTFTEADGGSHTFAATLNTAGAQSISAADAANGAINGSQGGIIVSAAPVTVQPGAAVALVIGNVVSPVAAGAPAIFSVTAVDNLGNIASGYTGPVHFSCTDPLAVLPPDTAFSPADAGQKTFNVTFKTAGSQTITAADAANPGMSGAAVILVQPAAASILVISGYPSPTLVGVPHSFKVAALDPFGNPAANYTGTIHFSSSDLTAALPADYTFQAADAGTQTFSAAFSTPGPQSIISADTAHAGVSGSQDGIEATLVLFPVGWSLFSLPYDFNGSPMDAASILGAAHNPDGTAPLFNYDPISATYVQYPHLPGADGTHTLPGVGYWVYETAPQALQAAGLAAPSPLDLTLHPGWNMVGDPYLAPLDWPSVQLSLAIDLPGLPAGALTTVADGWNRALIMNFLYGYSNEQNNYGDITTMQPFQGYWVWIYGDQPVTIRFTNPDVG